MVRLKITNLREFEARLSAGAQNLSNATFKHLRKEAQKFYNSLAGNVEKSSAYQRLRSDEQLRGQLGLAIPSRKYGSDTDAENLIELLRKFKTKTSKTRTSKKFTIVFPTLEQLEQRLTHNLTRVRGGRIIRGQRASWFRWWEFGDRGEIQTLTVTRRNIAKMLKTKSGKSTQTKSRTQLLEIIRDRSRSAAAIQLRDRSPDENTSIQGAGLIRQTYANYARIFPARMGLAMRRFVGKNNGRAEKFFARGVIR